MSPSLFLFYDLTECPASCYQIHNEICTHSMLSVRLYVQAHAHLPIARTWALHAHAAPNHGHSSASDTHAEGAINRIAHRVGAELTTRRFCCYRYHGYSWVQCSSGSRGGVGIHLVYGTGARFRRVGHQCNLTLCYGCSTVDRRRHSYVSSFVKHDDYQNEE